MSEGGYHLTATSHLNEATGNPKPASAGFVANVEVRKGPVPTLGDPAHDPFEGMLRGADSSVMPGLGLAVGFENGDVSLGFMDVQSDIQCVWGACVRFHSF